MNKGLRILSKIDNNAVENARNKLFVLMNLEINALKEKMKRELRFVKKCELELKIYDKEELLNAYKRVVLTDDEKIKRLLILENIYFRLYQHNERKISKNKHLKNRLDLVIKSFEYKTELEQISADIKLLKGENPNIKDIDLLDANRKHNDKLRELKDYLSLLKEKYKYYITYEPQNKQEEFEIMRDRSRLGEEILAKTEFIRHFKNRKNIF